MRGRIVCTIAERTDMTPEEKLKELGIELPQASPFHPAVALGVVTGNLLYCCGSTPGDKSLKGRVGDVYTTEEGYAAGADDGGVAARALAPGAAADLAARRWNGMGAVASRALSGGSSAPGADRYRNVLAFGVRRRIVVRGRDGEAR